MAKLDYTPQKSRLHGPGTIRLLCSPFQSHEDGLPEWLKNAADGYGRSETQASDRVIVVVFDSGRRKALPSISCLDLSGMTQANIEEDFSVWGNPDAAGGGGRSSDVQGGHGTGGKCYMTQMFEHYALVHTVHRGRGCRYGVNSGTIEFGYIPNEANDGESFVVEDMASQLQQHLKMIRCPLHSLPDSVNDAVRRAQGFTLVSGYGPKGYGNRIDARYLIEQLQEHPQMIRTLELCEVYAVVNGLPLGHGRPLTLPAIKPIKGYEEPRVVPIPATLKDPVSTKRLSTIAAGPEGRGTLTLRTSASRMTRKKRGRHKINFIAESDYIGYVDVLELDVQSQYRFRIYGECRLDTLRPFTRNERGRLAPSPLVRAVEAFVSRQIEEYAGEFEARDRQKYNKTQKHVISKMNEALDRWKNRFLRDLMSGLWGKGTGVKVTPTHPLPGGKPRTIEVALSHRRAGRGVAFAPTIRFLDRDGKRIRSAPFQWVSEDNNVAWVDEELMIVRTFAYGQTAIYAVTLDGKVRSNVVPLEVVRIRHVSIVPEQIDLSAGSRSKLEAVCLLESGEETRGVYLEWAENDDRVARVSSAGLVYGVAAGETTVTAWDEACEAENAARIKVGTSSGKGPGRRKGKGYPAVFVSGIDRDPETNEEVPFSRDEPPVHQRPKDVDRNIWWINSSAPLARLYLDDTKGYGFESREWRMYHVERYIDIIVQIAMTHGPTEGKQLEINDWIDEWGARTAEIQAAAAGDLGAFIAKGELPGA